jgi:uncharacterized membrane protein
MNVTRTPLWTPGRVVALATTAYAAVFFVLGADRYVTFHSGADLGLFAQTIASAFHGFSNTIEGGSHFTYHFSPILYLAAPLLWATHSALSLVFVQSVATSLVAPAIYAIARKRTTESRAGALACIALLYPPLQGVTFTDFHETAFVPAAVAWLLWAIDARRFGIAALMVVVALCTKEDQAPAMAFLGVAGCVYFGRRGERTATVFCASVIAVAIVVFAGYFAIVRPLAGATLPWAPTHFYAWYAPNGGPPWQEQIAGRLTYLIEAFVPLAFLPLRSPVVLLAIPGFAEVLGSHEPLTYTMGQHYAATWVPYVLVAFAIATARLLERDARAGSRWMRASAILCAATLVFFSPLHLGHFLRLPNARDAAMNVAIAGLPETAAIGTYDEVYAHLGFFPKAALGVRSHPQYVIYDDRYASTTWNNIVYPEVRRELERGDYHRVGGRDGVVLLERRIEP